MAKREEIYVLNEGGETLFYYSTLNEGAGETDQKQFLTASYLTAVIQFAKAAAKGNIIRHFEMGKVYKLISKKFFNCCIFENLLFRKFGEKKLLKNIHEHQLKKCVLKFNELQGQIKKCRPETPDKKIILDEINNGITF